MIQEGLKVGEATTSLKLHQNRELKQTELENVEIQKIDLESQSRVNESDQGATIGSIYSENKKEGEVLALDHESMESTREFQTKSSIYLADYLSAKEKLSAFASRKGGAPRRSRRAASPSTSSLKLTKKERTAVWELYKLFEQIESKKKELTPKLQQIDEQVVITESTRSRPSRSALEPSLAKMKWTTQENITYQNDPPRGRIGARSASNTSGYWNVWTNNPFQSFVSESSYQALIAEIKRLEQADKQQGRQGIMQRGMYNTIYHPTEQARLIKSKLQEAREAVANTVALKFLEWMEQADWIGLRP
ncbi:hypothetical protein MHM_03730 [Candidatus Mycoplasma haemominutum 'Birmingham 1']|uniref:Uncharacterized protein n=1 Tax=Candidatus Mycoplasma haematominutum 'Birmingham 1' TaxID=1116213 RepID=G8C3J3_9MOLU|nr:hypothetical protein MHM_03730 [Candidatus Mycoplasma haematominutum 'Birmingham 1']